MEISYLKDLVSKVQEDVRSAEAALKSAEGAVSQAFANKWLQTGALSAVAHIAKDYFKCDIVAEMAEAAKAAIEAAPEAKTEA